MSKICEKCGNVIPEDMDHCPICGSDGVEDDALQSVLNELGLAMEEIGDAAEDAAPDQPVEEPTVALPDLKAVKDHAEPAADPDRQPARPAQPKNPTKKAAPKGNHPAGTAPKSGSAGKKKKKKKKKKQNSAAMIGVVIGLVIALLLIGCGVLFMLFQMGFFVQMSDDELLQTPTVTQNVIEVSPSPSQEPVLPSPSAPAVVEEPSVVEEEPVASPEPTEELNCTKFTITGTEYVYLYSRGETTELSYVIEPAEYRSKINWSSSDESIATVSNLGVIRARRGGTCTITGECGGKSITAYITCQFTVPDTVLDMNMEDITLTYEGQTAGLEIDYELTDEQIAYTVWESSDPAVATVNENGVVTAVADGTAVITASIADYTASCIVRCVGVTGNKGVNSDASEYVINLEDVTLTRKGEYFQLTLTSVLGKEVPEFTWTSDDPSVAKVDSKGVVTAVSNGTANITTSIGADKFQCIVRVNFKN